MLAGDKAKPASWARLSEPTGRALSPCSVTSATNTSRWRSVRSGSSRLTRPGKTGWDMRSEYGGRRVRVKSEALATTGTGPAIGGSHEPCNDVVGNESVAPGNAESPAGGFETPGGPTGFERGSVAPPYLAPALRRVIVGIDAGGESEAEHHDLVGPRAGGLGLDSVAGRVMLERRAPEIGLIVVGEAHTAPQPVRRGSEPEVVAAQPVDQVVARLAP